MTHSTWKAIPVGKACDILNFWATAPWPMDRKQTFNYAAQLGWATEEDEDEIYLINEAAGLTIPDVDTPHAPSGDIASIIFYLTDVTRGELTDEATTFLDDHFTLYYREMAARWGEGKQSTLDSDARTAEWELGANKGRVSLMRNARSITASFETPQYAKVLRDLGE